MKTPPAAKIALLWLSCLGLLLPQPAIAADVHANPAGLAQPKRALPTGDATLGAQGSLRGRVVDCHGAALPGTPVAFFQQDGLAARVTTDAEGRFVVTDLRPGRYLVVGGEGAAIYRVWAARVAPPSAAAELLIISDGTIVRGQGGAYLWISEHFFLTSALVAAAITVPLVTIGHGDDDPASP